MTLGVLAKQLLQESGLTEWQLENDDVKKAS